MDSHCLANGVIDIGGRILLRPMAATYADGLWVAYWRNRARANYFSQAVVTPTSHMRWFTNRSPLDEIWLVYSKASSDRQRPIGLTSITVDPSGALGYIPLTGEYGRTAVDEHFQHLGFGREIEYSAMLLGFELLYLDLLWGELYVDNDLIARVHDRIGWTRVGVNVLGHSHPPRDVLYIECTKAQWVTMRREFAEWMAESYGCQIALGEWS